MSIGVRWFTINRLDEVLSFFIHRKDDFGTIKKLTLLGKEPLKMSGNHRVLVFSGLNKMTIKVDSPSDVCYCILDIYNAIMNGLSETDYDEINKIILDHEEKFFN